MSSHQEYFLGERYDFDQFQLLFRVYKDLANLDWIKPERKYGGRCDKISERVKISTNSVASHVLHCFDETVVFP